MTAIIINSNPLNDSHVLTASPEGRCKHHTRNGRCRMPVADPLTSLCAEHGRRQQKRDHAASLSAELIAGLTEFKSAVPINDFLSRLLLLQAQERISPRRAAVMAYTSSAPFPPSTRSKRIRIKPAKTRICSIFSPPHLQEIILQKRRFAAEHHAKRQANLQPEEAGRAFYARLSRHSGSNDTNAPNTTNTKELS